MPVSAQVLDKPVLDEVNEKSVLTAKAQDMPVPAQVNKLMKNYTSCH